MFGVPGIFRKLEAAILAARSYAIESGIDYGVMEKKMDYGEDNVWYQPVSANDTKKAEIDGYEMLIGPNVLRSSESTHLSV